MNHVREADQINNIDESEITAVQTPRKVISRRGCKQIGRVASAEKEMATTII